MNADLVHPRERALFAVSVVVSALVYVALLAVGRTGIAVLAGGAVLALVLNGWSVGWIRGNGVRISESQLPEVHRLAEELARELGLKALPALYVVEAGGALNAFATKFVRRDFVVVYSDLLELAYSEGKDELGFVLGHELAHVKRRHVFWQWVLTPAAMIPFLGHAYSRACEYTCDRIASRLRPEGAVGGLCVLAVGKRLYRRLDARKFAEQAWDERGFWVWLVEMLSGHPRLPKRVDALASFSRETDFARRLEELQLGRPAASTGEATG